MVYKWILQDNGLFFSAVYDCSRYMQIHNVPTMLFLGSISIPQGLF